MSQSCCRCGPQADTSRLVEFKPFDVRVCLDCGLVFLTSAVDPGEFVEAARSQLAQTAEKKLEYWSFPQLYDKYRRVFDTFFEQRLGRLGKAVNPLGDVLDIGCGYGFFGNYLRKSGVRVVGVEISSECIEYARSQFDMEVSHCDFMEFHSECRFDALVACDVLEHIRDPAAFLEKCSRLLRPQGAIYLLSLIHI